MADHLALYTAWHDGKHGINGRVRVHDFTRNTHTLTHTAKPVPVRPTCSRDANGEE